MTRAARRRSAVKRHGVVERARRAVRDLVERLRYEAVWAWRIAYMELKARRTRSHVLAMMLVHYVRMRILSLIRSGMEQAKTRHQRDDPRMWIVTSYPRSVVEVPDALKKQVQAPGELAYYMSQTVPTPLSTCRAHERCRSSKDYVPWTPDRVGVHLYYAATLTKPVTDFPAFSTIPYGYFWLPMAGALPWKPADEIWTAVFLLAENVTSPADRAAVVRDTRGEPRLTVPAIIVAYMHHRVLKIKGVFVGRSEDADAWVHCSAYYLPRDLRPARGPRRYVFFEWHAGLWNWRRVRVKEPMKWRRR